MWRDKIAGAVIAIGNAPTALFRLFEMMDERDLPRPAAIIVSPLVLLVRQNRKTHCSLMAVCPVLSCVEGAVAVP